MIPDLIQLKRLAYDGKSRLTDFSSIQGVQIFLNYLPTNVSNRYFRVNIRQDDEVLNFHQLVIEYLCYDWDIEHHFQLASGAEIDMLAYSKANPQEILLIECKPNLSRSKFYTAVGQVFAYQAEYGNSARVAIATNEASIKPYFAHISAKMGIELLGIQAAMI